MGFAFDHINKFDQANIGILIVCHAYKGYDARSM